MSEIEKYIIKNSDLDQKMVKKLSSQLTEADQFIDMNDIKEWFGYKKKQTVKDILLNDKYGFIENTDYKLELFKPKTGRPGETIYLSVDTIKCICLMAPTEESQKFRRYYIEMERLFKQYVSTEVQNKLTNPIPEIEYKNFDLDPYIGKETLYLIKVTDNVYKYGITTTIQKRLTDHKRLFNYKHIIKIWDCTNRSVSKEIETKIKLYAKINKLFVIYKKSTECIQTDNITKIIKVFDDYTDQCLTAYKKIYRDEHLTQKMEYAELMLKLIKAGKKVDNLNFTIDNTHITDDQITQLMQTNSSKNVPELLQEKLEEEETTPKPDIVYNDDDCKLIWCKRCRAYKEESAYETNKRTNKLYSQCIPCKISCKASDDKRKDDPKRKEYNKAHNKIYAKEHQEEIQTRRNANYKTKAEILKRNKKYYDENSEQIIEQKKIKAVVEKYKGENTDIIKILS